MSFSIKHCSIDEVGPHPTIADRTRAKVRVLLEEKSAGNVFQHNLVLKVWAATTPLMSEDQVKTALLSRAAHILNKTIKAAEPPTLKAAE